jgi:hypothetical protein
MGISFRCHGSNLLNHLRQQGQLLELDTTYERVRENNRFKWHCYLKYNNETYHGISMNKKHALCNILEMNDPLFRSMVNIQ